jgi:type I restriction enzyme, S subunit
MNWYGNPLPPGWTLTRFGRETSVNVGLVDPEDQLWCDMPLVAPNHIESHTGRLLPRESASEQAAESGKCLVREGQVIYSKIRPALNKVTIAAEDCLCSADMYAISSRGRLNHRYLMYCMLSGPFLSYVTQMSERVKMPKVNREELAAAPVLHPPLMEQVAVADFLDRETAKIDALIEKQRALASALDERRATTVRALALGQGGLELQSAAWFGVPPAHWVLDKLGRHARIVNGSTPNRENPGYWTNGTFPWLNSSVANLDQVEQAGQFVTAAALDQCHLPILTPGTVLIGITGQGRTRGMATLLQMTATINQHLAGIVVDRRFWHPEYLRQLLRAAYGELRFMSDEAGSTKGALTCSALAGFRVPRPPLDEQRRIAEAIAASVVRIDVLMARTQQFITLAQERRAALITAAVTGQLDVGKVA